MASDWQMPRAARECAACAHAFETGDVLQVVLLETPTGYTRADYCQRCAPPAEPLPVARWQTRRAAPAPRARQVFDREAVYRFFLRLEDADQADKVQFRFVLALVLWRKKVLKFQYTTESGGKEFWEFAVSGSDQTHRVERPDLAEDRLEELSAQLEQILGGDLEALDAAATTEGHRDG